MVFSQKGYSEATLKDIAEHAGTQAGSLYYHFASRDHIVREVLFRAMNGPAAAVRELVDSMPPSTSYVERIHQGMIAYLEIILGGDSYVAAYNRIINQVSEEVRLDYLQHPRAFGHFWQDLIEKGQSAGEIRSDFNPRLLMLHLMGSATWTFEWYDPKGSHSPKEIADHLIRAFVEGAAPVQAASGQEQSDRYTRRTNAA